MEDALKWWNSLTESGRNAFPVPRSEEDILLYYESPAEYSLPPNITY